LTSLPGTCHWRLIDSPPNDGRTNMAVDEALLLSFNSGGSQPAFRTYGWNPPALSIGRFQNVAETIDQVLCRQMGVPIVRRITGGGAIFHADELTYSIVCTQEQISPAASVKDSFRVLTGFLVEFYRSLGLDARYAVDSSGSEEGLGVRTPFCFAGRESFDILINGRKIGGNAQRRNRNIIFQHGSIPVVNRSRDGLRYMRDRSASYAEHTTSLFECGVTDDPATLNGMLAAAFRQHMAVELCECGLTAAEEIMMRELLENSYTRDQWNLKGERT